MKTFRHRIFVYLFSSTILLANVTPLIALDTVEKTEVVVQKADSTKLTTEQEIKVESTQRTEKNMEQSPGNTSYNFIFYLVTMVLRALSYYPQN